MNARKVEKFIIDNPGSGAVIRFTNLMAAMNSGRIIQVSEFQEAAKAIEDEIELRQNLAAYIMRRGEHAKGEPHILWCPCGREVELFDPLNNECECGMIYNLFGQAIARPRGTPGEFDIDDGNYSDGIW